MRAEASKDLRAARCREIAAREGTAALRGALQACREQSERLLDRLAADAPES